MTWWKKEKPKRTATRVRAGDGALSLPIMGYRSLLVVPVADQILCKHSVQSKRLIQNLRSDTWEAHCINFKRQDITLYTLYVTLYTNATVLQRRHRNSYTPMWNKPMLIHFKTFCAHPRRQLTSTKTKETPATVMGFWGWRSNPKNVLISI